MTRLVQCALGLAALVAAVDVPSAQQPPRENILTRIGTATISGIIMSDETASRPIRHAVVSLMGTTLSFEREAVTDDLGRFVVPGLPAGSYTVRAARPGYVPMSYGQKRPARGSGVVLSIVAGQSVDTGVIRLPRGAVIAGTISDESGRPRRGVQISIMEYRYVNGDRQLANVPAGQGLQVATDDRGMYRAYGLPAGEYVVSAAPPSMEGLDGGTELRRVSAAELDWADRQLRSNTGIAVARTGVARPEPPPRPGIRVGLAPLYYPGTADPSMAMAIRVGAGEERMGVDFAVGFVPTAKVEGVVVGPDGQPVAANIAVLSMSSTALRMSPPNLRADSQGKFTVASLPPGQFTIMARAPNALPNVGPNAAPNAALWASVDIGVNGQDLSGVNLMLQPGSVLSGRIAFEGATLPLPKDFSQVRVSLNRAGDAAARSPQLGITAGRVRPDGTFEIAGIVPGSYRLISAGLGPQQTAGGVWTLKSSLVAGRDVADAPFDIRPGETVSNVLMTFTDRVAEISGTLSDTSGRPAPDYFVVAFSSDRNEWIPGSRRVRPPVRPASDGKYRLAALPPGTYFMAALTDVDPEDMNDRTFLEQVAASAITITLADGEKKVQDLRLATAR